VQDANPNGKLEGVVPWVRTYHSNEPLRLTAPDRWQLSNWIFVSRSHARANGRNRFVYNGIDPQEFIYSESKDDYFLFAVGDLSRANQRDSGLRWNYKSDVASGSSLLVGLMKKELSGGNAIGGQASNSLVGFENAKEQSCSQVRGLFCFRHSLTKLSD
jgi:hypothetical protein